MKNNNMFNAINEVLKTAGVTETETTITIFSNASQLGKSFNKVVLEKHKEYGFDSDESKLLRNNLWMLVSLYRI